MNIPTHQILTHKGRTIRTTGVCLAVKGIVLKADKTPDERFNEVLIDADEVDVVNDRQMELEVR